MSEEFEFSASFELENRNSMIDLDSLIELFDLGETVEARALLNRYKLSEAQQLIGRLTDRHSIYSGQDDLVDMFMETYNASIDDIELNSGKSGNEGVIKATGQGREAIDFCASLVLALIALQASSISARASSVTWNATWQAGSTGIVKFKLEIDE